MTDQAESDENAAGAMRHVEMHFAGGLRGSNWQPSELVVWPVNGPHRLRVKDIPKDQILYAISSLGLVCIGIDEVVEEPHLITRIWHPFWYGGTIHDDPCDRWSGIKTAAQQASDVEFTLLAEKVAFSLRAMGIRLRGLSDEYLRQLKAAFGRGTGLQHRFTNVAVLDLYLACHSLLAEMGSARDYLATVIARHANAPEWVDSLANLRKWMLKNDADLPEVILNAIGGSSSDDWLSDLASYRNAFVHRSPVSTIDSARRLRLREHETPHGPLRSVTLEVPVRLPKGKPPSDELTDALERFYVLSSRLARFAADVAVLAPYAPSITTLTETNTYNLQCHGIVDSRF